MVTANTVTEMYNALNATDRLVMIGELQVIIEFLGNDTSEASVAQTLSFTKLSERVGTITIRTGTKKTYTIAFNE